ncbi:MAG: heat-inducible transcriptional repressor HrcA [Coprothermobacterota bacterium]|nr:heat-inducible transcriptional repressor HrcA [Coprothermobacterota bacterium]
MTGTSYLSDRRKAILKAVVEEYILNGQPIGSEELLRKYSLGCSSATIRAELAALEEMEYLSHPHTSAGRIPTEQGYRIYVDHLLVLSPVSFQEEEKISQVLNRQAQDLRNILAEACRLVATISTYTSLALAPQANQQVMRHIHFVPVSAKQALVILVTSLKVIQDQFLEVSAEVSEEDLEYLSHYLSRRLLGKTPWQCLQELPVIREEQPARLVSLLNQLSTVLHNVFLYEQSERLIVEGAENLLLASDFRNSFKQRRLADALDRRFLLQDVLDRHLTSRNLQIFIGQENEVVEMHDLTLLAMPFEASRYAYGALGLLGPMRMDYAKGIRLLACVTGVLERALSQEA